MKLKFNVFDVGPAIADYVNDVLVGIDGPLKGVVSDLKTSIEGQLNKLVSDTLHSTRQQYLDGVEVVQDGLKITVHMDSSISHLEEGYGSFDMKPGLLKSGMNGQQLGSYNSNRPGGQGQVHISKDGHRYRYIPMEKSGSKQNAGRQIEHQQTIEQRGGPGPNALPAQGRISGAQEATDFLRAKKTFAMGKTISHDNGAPIQGRVASIYPDPNNSKRWFRKNYDGSVTSYNVKKPFDKNLVGLSKYQKTVAGHTFSSFVTFRVVSDNPASQGKWIHPGFAGAHIMPKLEDWINREIENKINQLLANL